MSARIVTMRSGGGRRHEGKGLDFRLTQRLHPARDVGRYAWALMDVEGNVLQAGASVGSVHGRASQRDADRLAREAIGGHEEQARFEEDDIGPPTGVARRGNRRKTQEARRTR